MRVEGDEAVADEGPFVLAKEVAASRGHQFLLQVVDERVATLEWLTWQVANLGPMAGQNHHFKLYAPEKLPYAAERYVKETNRLYGVLNRRLADRAYLAGEEYTIADIASYPWIVPWKRQSQNLDDFPNVRRWFESIRYRPATVRAYERAQEFAAAAQLTSEESRRILFGQTAASVEQMAGRKGT